MDEIADGLDPTSQIVISTVSGVSIADIRTHLGPEIPIVRDHAEHRHRDRAVHDLSRGRRRLRPRPAARSRNCSTEWGGTMVIQEEQMVPATALCACGIAFFLRAIRAASQGGIEIGFHADEAITLAAQTARGAAALLSEPGETTRRPRSTR